MAHKCYISFKAEDLAYKLAIQELGFLDIIDKSLNSPIRSEDEDYILQKIRSDYLADSTVTIHLIGSKSAEILGWEEQRFIKRELQGSLYDAERNTKNGILGIVLPEVERSVFRGSTICATCGTTHEVLAINDSTVVTEFSYNYFIPHGKCSWTESERYCVLVKWDGFVQDPNSYIEAAFANRTAPIASKTRVRP